MYKTKAQLAVFITLAVLCIVFAVCGALTYLHVDGTLNFINFIKQGNGNWKAVSAIFFAASSIFFWSAIIVFAFYITKFSHNKKIVKLVRFMKVKFAEKHNVTKERVDEELELYVKHHKSGQIKRVVTESSFKDKKAIKEEKLAEKKKAKEEKKNKDKKDAAAPTDANANVTTTTTTTVTTNTTETANNTNPTRPAFPSRPAAPIKA